MKLKITLVIIIVCLIALNVFIISNKVSQAQIELSPKCPTFTQAVKAKCNCPEVIYEIGCTNGIDGATRVKINNAQQLILDNKEYNIADIQDTISPIRIR